MRPAFILVAAMLLLVGCASLFGGPASDNSTNANSTLGQQPPAGIQNSSNATPEECKRQFTFCYTGETIMSRDCIDNKAIKWVCEPYYVLHNKSIDNIPAPFLYLADYACYWGVRDKFGYAANYNPAYVCQGPIVAGWIESCDCAGYIELTEQSHPQRYYIKR